MAEGPRQVEESLKAAAEGHIEDLYGSLKKDPTVFDGIDAIPFVETPLHVATLAGQELLVREILRLKPSFGRKLNPDGLSSLHLALIKRKFDMVQLLIDLDKELIRVKGKKGETPLHLIVNKEDIDQADADQQQRVEGKGSGGEQQRVEGSGSVDQQQRVEGSGSVDQQQRVEGRISSSPEQSVEGGVSGGQQQRLEGSVHGGEQKREDPRILKLAEFLFACPNSIEDRTIHDETALHIAVKTKNTCAVKVILGFLIRINKKEVLAATDYQGNTALHKAVKNLDLEMVNLLVKKVNKAYINKKNSVERKTALDIALSLGTVAESIATSLRNAGAKTSSSSADDYSRAKFLSSPEHRIEVFYKILLFRRKRFILSMDQGNLGLVVAVLIATTTFQAILTPPGGQGGGNDQLLTNGSYVSANVSSSSNHLIAANTSFINATLFIPTDAHGETKAERFAESIALIKFYEMNQIAFFCSMLAIMSVLPFARLASLHGALVFLIFSYNFSFDLALPNVLSASTLSWLSFPSSFFWIFYSVRIMWTILTNTTSVDMYIERSATQRVRMLRRLIRNYDGE